MLYLAARNEHIQNKIKPAISKKKIVICDRFIDSTFAYQVYGKGVNKKFVDLVHKYILGNIKPDMTFILKVNISKESQRLKKRVTKKNRYDKFSKNFYTKAQKAFIKIAKKNKKKYLIINSNDSIRKNKKIILNKTNKLLNI